MELPTNPIHGQERTDPLRGSSDKESTSLFQDIIMYMPKSQKILRGAADAGHLGPRLVQRSAGRDSRGGGASTLLEWRNRRDFNLENCVHRIVKMGAALVITRYFKGRMVPALRYLHDGKAKRKKVGASYTLRFVNEGWRVLNSSGCEPRLPGYRQVTAKLSTEPMFAKRFVPLPHSCAETTNLSLISHTGLLPSGFCNRYISALRPFPLQVNFR